MRLFLLWVLALSLSACSGPSTGGSGNPTRSAMNGEIVMNGYTGYALKGPSFTVVEAAFAKLSSQVKRKYLAFSEKASLGNRGMECKSDTTPKSRTSAAAASSLISVGTLALGFPPDGSDSRMIDAMKDGSYYREFTELFKGGLYSFTAGGSSVANPFRGILLLPVELTQGKLGDRSLQTEAVAIQKSVNTELSWDVGEVSDDAPSVIDVRIYSENETEKNRLECSIEEKELPNVAGRRVWTIESARFKDLIATPGGLIYLTRIQGHRSSDEKIGEIVFLGAQTLVSNLVIAE